MMPGAAARSVTRLAVAASTAVLLAGPLAAQGALEVKEHGPQGVLDALEEANEVRVGFSEPMVVLGRIPDPVQAPFFRIEPSVKGRFRWAGTRTLVFTPDAPLPYGTRYEVTVDTTATAARGARLAAPFTFWFTTPVVELESVYWYRRERRFDRPVVLVLDFNQPVSAAGVLPHLSVRHEPHAFEAPPLDAEEEARWRAKAPGSLEAFRAKVEGARRAASSRDAVAVREATDWDRKAYPPASTRLVVETATVPPPDAWLRVALAGSVRGLGGPETPGREQQETVRLEPTLFVNGFSCRAACDPADYNPLRFRGAVDVAQARQRTAVADVTDPREERPLTRAPRPQGEEGDEDVVEEDPYDQASHVAMEDLGFGLRPARTYAVRVAAALRARDGQTLGYDWLGTVENWHHRAFTSFGSGHGVWEAEGGPQVPFYARNLRSVSEWLRPLKVDELVPTLLRLQESSFVGSPEGDGVARTLHPRADVIQSYGLDLSPVLGPGGTALAWAALRDGTAIAMAHHDRTPRPRSAILQATRLGITVKDSPSGWLVLVTRLADAAPVAGATVRIRSRENAEVWSGVTGPDGVARVPALEGLHDPAREWQFRFVVVAEKDGDLAYVGSDWNDGIQAWAFGLRLDLDEAKPILRGKAFPDRGVYKLGEEAKVKVVLRSDTGAGMLALPAGTSVDLVLRNSQGEDVRTATLPLSDWSSAEWTVTVPEGGPLGTYELRATVAGQRDVVTGSFLVAAYRRPDFRVDAELAGEVPVAGGTLKGVVTGRYLFGGAMAGRPARWTYARRPLVDAPQAVVDKLPAERWVVVDEQRENRWQRGGEELQAQEGTLDAQGQLALDLQTKMDGQPWTYTLEGEVTDVSRQKIANRASFRVEPAPFYVGLKRPPYFATAEKGMDTEVAGVLLDGRPAAGVPVTVVLTRVQWHAARRAEGQGYYTWETERRETEARRWEVVTADTPQPLQVDLPGGGYYVLRASAKDEEGRSNAAAVGFYALGAGYTAWERYDHNRIDLVPEKARYRPGETARLLVKSPWEGATALLTVEREGIRSYEVFTLRSTQETVTVPVTEADVPNVFVSVVLLKGRSGEYAAEDSSDPGRPAHRVGYARLEVEDASKTLEVELRSDREEYRPAAKAQVSVAVRDREGRGVASEVTLWAVDHGVLSLTGYRAPDLKSAVWVEKALQVMTQDSRQNIVSRRVIVAKGEDEGGGGGGDDGPGTQVRKDFRVLAFWLGSVRTDAEGRAGAEVKLPEDLTTYRIMAVAADRQSRFGKSEREIRTSKPVLLRPAFPRFLARGDAARFGAVVHSLLKDKGTAIVTLRSLDPAVVEVAGESKQAVVVPPKGAVEVRFEVRAKAVGRARLQMTARLRGETDAFEAAVPVEVFTTPEVVAAYGLASPEAHETIVVPQGVVPGVGGLRLELASTALVGLGEGARYLVEYPYGCAEQRSSAALGLMLAADLGDTFTLPEVPAGKMKAAAAATLDELAAFQCPGGGFAFWKGRCEMTSPYLTAWVLHVLQRGRSLGYVVADPVLENARGYLEKSLGASGREGPVDIASDAFALKVLAEGGRPQDSHVNRVMARLDKAPVFAMAYLLDALVAVKDTSPRREELRRRIRNAILPEGGTAHVEELDDEWLLWIWSSNPRSTAIALGALVRDGLDQEFASRMARWLMQVRKKGRWGNTQENATAMDALVTYYRAFEAEPPDFRAVVALQGEELATGEFRGRSTAAQARDVPLATLAARAGSGPADLAFRREGTGTLHYVARLSYALDAPDVPAADQGFVVERTLAPAAEGASPGLSFAAGDTVRVTLTVRVPKERRFVALTDPLPAGLEPVESWFATTAGDMAREAERDLQPEWGAWWERGGFDRVERHDDRVLLFATRLAEGEHVFSYLARATTAGTFRVAPARAEEMYSPEVFGRSGAIVVTVR